MAKIINAMPFKIRSSLSPKKLLLSKWTAVHPIHQRKHFLVIKFVLPEAPNEAIEFVELEAVFDKKVQKIAWRELTKREHWQQGWL